MANLHYIYIYIYIYIYKNVDTVLIGISAHGRLRFKARFLADKRPWALVRVGALSSGFLRLGK